VVFCGKGRRERGKGEKEWQAECAETDGENFDKSSLREDLGVAG